MKRMALMVVSMVVILSVNLYAQGEPKYRVVVLNFIEETNSYKSLERSLPKALESEISNSCKPLIEMLERSQMEEVLEEVEYQYDRQVLFDKTTIAKVNWKGANAVIVGKIKPQRDEIRVDVKLVEIETGRQLGQAYTIPRANELQTLSQIAGKMKELASDLCNNSTSTPPQPTQTTKPIATPTTNSNFSCPVPFSDIPQTEKWGKQELSNVFDKIRPLTKGQLFFEYYENTFGRQVKIGRILTAQIGLQLCNTWSPPEAQESAIREFFEEAGLQVDKVDMNPPDKGGDIKTIAVGTLKLIE